MRTFGKIVLGPLLLAILIFSCSKEEDPSEVLVKEGPFKISELAGTWNATRASFSDGMGNNVEIIGDGGTVSMSVQSNGRFNLTIDPFDRPAYIDGGEMFWEEWEGNFFFAIEWNNYPGDWDTYGANLMGNTFDISGGFESGEYDFDNDGDFESASISFVFERQ